MNVFKKILEISLEAPEKRYKDGLNIDLEEEGLEIRGCNSTDEDKNIKVKGRCDRDILNDILTFLEKEILPLGLYQTHYLSEIHEIIMGKEYPFASTVFSRGKYCDLPEGLIKLVFLEHLSGNYEGILAFELDKVTDKQILEKTKITFEKIKKQYELNDIIFDAISDCYNSEEDTLDKHHKILYELLKKKFMCGEIND